MSKHTRVTKWTAAYRTQWNRRYSRQYRAAHPRKTKTYNRAYRTANPDKVRTLQKSWRRVNRKRVRQYGKKWRAKNYQDILKRNRLYYREHREEMNAKHRARFQASPELRRRKSIGRRRWYLANRAAIRDQQRKYLQSLSRAERYRRGLRAQLRHKYGMTLEQFDRMNQAQKGRCAVCGKRPDRGRKRLDVDHNHKTNKTRGLLCSPCNIFLHHLETYPERIPKLRTYLKRYC